MGFIFGGNTGETAESIARKRKIAQQMLQANARTPRNVGEGIAAIGRALAARYNNSRADEAEKAGQEAWQEKYGSRFGQIGTEGGDVPSYGMSHIVDALSDDFAPEGFKAMAPTLVQALQGPEAMTPYQRARLALDRAKHDARMKSGGYGTASTRVEVGGGGPKFEIGRIEPGYMLTYDESGRPSGMVPIPGSPAADEKDAEAEAEQKRGEGKVENATLQSQEIERAIKMIQEAPRWRTGIAAQLLRDVGGTGAFDLNQTITTIRANIGFDRLQKMREESPTGGALGQVTERELANLQAVLGSLDTAQSAEQLVANLTRLDNLYADVLKKAGSYPNAHKFGFAPPSANAGGERKRRRYNPETGGFE
jgi:hypothetical protein